MKYRAHKLLENIEMKLSEVIVQNESMAGQISKVEGEIIAKFAELQAQIAAMIVELADVTLSDSQAAAVNAVAEGVQRLEDIVPDAV